MIRHPPSSTLFPNTTLFGSENEVREPVEADQREHQQRGVPSEAPKEVGERRAERARQVGAGSGAESRDRKSTRLNSSHANISYAVFCLKKKTQRGMCY